MLKSHVLHRMSHAMVGASHAAAHLSHVMVTKSHAMAHLSHAMAITCPVIGQMSAFRASMTRFRLIFKPFVSHTTQSLLSAFLSASPRPPRSLC